MKPTQTLPESHALAWEVNLKKNKRLNILLQTLGLFWVFLVILFFWWVFSWLRFWTTSPALVFSGSDLANFLIQFLLVLVISISLHELTHGVFFWIFAKHRPQFGLGPGYAYAAMPGWYFPKRAYLLIGLAPLFVLTALGLLCVPFLPGWLLMPFFWGLVLNAGGAIGDLYVCLRIGLEPEDIWIKDLGDGFEVYRRKAEFLPPG